MKKQPIIFIVENTLKNAGPVRMLNRELRKLKRKYEKGFPEMEIAVVYYDKEDYVLHQDFVSLDNLRVIPVKSEYTDETDEWENRIFHLLTPPYLGAMVQTMYILQRRTDAYEAEGLEYYRPKVFHFASTDIEIGSNPEAVLGCVEEFCGAPECEYRLYAGTGHERPGGKYWLIWPMTANINWLLEPDMKAVASFHTACKNG